MCMFRQAVQNIIFCNVSRARCRGAFRLLVLAGKAKPVLWPRGFLRVRPQICLPPLFSGPNGDLGVGVLSSYRGADWDKVGDAFAIGEQIIPAGHWIRKSEASFNETLELVKKINPRLAIATHIEELNGRSYADYVELEKKYKKNRLHFAYDGFRELL